jgi:hypothetical protein
MFSEEKGVGLHRNRFHKTLIATRHLSRARLENPLEISVNCESQVSRLPKRQVKA